MTLKDREELNKEIATYPIWTMVISTLLPYSLPGTVTFDFYENNSDTPSTSAVPIQTVVGISIDFNMDVVPIDNTDCYVKYTFPNDIQLPSTPL